MVKDMSQARVVALQRACLLVLCVATSAPGTTGEVPAPFIISVGGNAQRPPASAWRETESDMGGNPPGKHYVVMASDATAGYAFYIPLSVRMWKEVAGFDSIVVLVGGEWREQTQGYTQSVLDALAEAGARIVVLDVPVGSYTLSTVAQVSRLLVPCALDTLLNHDDFLLLMDVDMWPLNHSHFKEHAAAMQTGKSPYKVVMNDGFCCGAKPVALSGFRSRNDDEDPDRHPDFYRVYAAGKGVGATVGAWKQIFGGYLASIPVGSGACEPRAPADAHAPPHSTGQGAPKQESEAQVLQDIVLKLLDAMLVLPLGMGKLGQANRRELELSGRYSFGQIEWELDQRVLGLAIKTWGGCCRGECMRITLVPGAMLDRDEAWPPDVSAQDREAATTNMLAGRVQVHLPMAGRGNEADSGYGQVGWKRVEWVLTSVLHHPSLSPYLPVAVQRRRRELEAWARSYKHLFVAGMAQEVLGCIVSVVDLANLDAAQQLLSLVAGLYGRRVYVLLFTVGLSEQQLQHLQIWRNVLVAGIPPEVAQGLPDVELLRHQAVLEAPKHPLLHELRTILYVSPRVRVCSGALELAFNHLRDDAEGVFGLAAAIGAHDARSHAQEQPPCRWQVVGYLVGGVAWKALERSMQDQKMPPVPRQCQHVPAFLVPEGPRGGGVQGGTGEVETGSRAACAVLDTVYSPLIKRPGVVMVIGKVSDVLVADLLGANRVGDDAAQAGNCTFLPFSSQLLPLTDAVVAPLSYMCASDAARTLVAAHEQLPGQVWALLADAAADDAVSPCPAECRAKLPRHFFSRSAHDGNEWHDFVAGGGEQGQEEQEGQERRQPLLIDVRPRRVNAATLEAGFREGAVYGGVWWAGQVCEAALARARAAGHASRARAASGAPAAGSAGSGAPPTCSASSRQGRAAPLLDDKETEVRGGAVGRDAEDVAMEEGSVGAGVIRDGGVAIVTAASRNYFGCLQNLVGSIHVWGGRRDGPGRVQARRIVVYDLGLSTPQITEMRAWRDVEVLPTPWHRASLRALQLYAWKIGAWADAADRLGSFVFIDACSELRGPLVEIEVMLASRGVFLTEGAEGTKHNIDRDSDQLTHKMQVSRLLALHRGYLDLSALNGSARRSELVGDAKRITHGGDTEAPPSGDGELGEERFRLRRPHCLAGLVGLNASHPAARPLLEILEQCAKDADCIAPLGSNQTSHRYEQAALSVTAQLLGIDCHTDPRFWGFFLKSGDPSVELDDDERAPSRQVVFARRRHIHKPFTQHLQRKCMQPSSETGGNEPTSGHREPQPSFASSAERSAAGGRMDPGGS